MEKRGKVYMPEEKAPIVRGQKECVKLKNIKSKNRTVNILFGNIDVNVKRNNVRRRQEN